MKREYPVESVNLHDQDLPGQDSGIEDETAAIEVTGVVSLLSY